MNINKIQLNPNQIQLAKSWLKYGCEPYAYNPDIQMLWFRELHCSGVPIKNGLKLSSDQIQKLTQLS